MNTTAIDQHNEVGGADNPNRPVRADAQRNIQSLLKVALSVFATAGVDAPVRQIAQQAGVGVGTVYRHFPTRADLIVAVFRQEIDDCAETAEELASIYAPAEALTLWIDRYVGFIGTKLGLANALHSGDPAYEALPAYFDARLRPAVATLLDAAASAGQIRANVDADDLLWAVASLSGSRHRDPEQGKRMVAMFLDGLRSGAESPGGR